MTDMTPSMRIRAIMLDPDPIPMSAIPNGLLLRVEDQVRQAAEVARRGALEECLDIIIDCGALDAPLPRYAEERVRALMENPNVS